jgi:YfiH family protein
MTTFPNNNKNAGRQSFILPQWRMPQPERITAFTTTREGGVSLPPYESFNCALHVGDDVEAVQANRQILAQKISSFAKIPSPVQPFWLDQRHTTTIVKVTEAVHSQGEALIADASWTTLTNVPLAVMTADCLPILVTNQAQSLVCAIHAGWKGCADGIIQKTIQALPEKPENLIAWIGPSIRQDHFEVGEEVRQAFAGVSPETLRFFKPHRLQMDKYWADLAGIAQCFLRQAGVQSVTDSGLCSYADARFYSYRQAIHQGREGGKTGRMTSVIMLRG